MKRKKTPKRKKRKQKKKKKATLQEVQHFLYFNEKKRKQLMGDFLKLTTKQPKKISRNSINTNDTSLWMVL